MWSQILVLPGSPQYNEEEKRDEIKYSKKVTKQNRRNENKMLNVCSSGSI
jgi:hypothetical protein